MSQVARRKDKLDDVAKQCKDAGAEVLALYLDLGVTENNETAIKETINKFGRET